MGPAEQDRWRDEALDAVLEFIAADQELRECLIFKGARILNKRLPSLQRRSLDLDANLADNERCRVGSVEGVAHWLETAMLRAMQEILNFLIRDGWYFARTRGSHRQFRHPIKAGLKP